MPTQATPPPLGSVTFDGQDLGLAPEITEGPHAGLQPLHRLVIIDPVTRVIAGYKTCPSGAHPWAALGVRLEPEQVLVYWGFRWTLNSYTSSGEYLPYPPHDGIPIHSTVEPVNQIPNGTKWRNILSKFAHDIIRFNPAASHLRAPETHATGHETPNDATAALQNKVTYQLGRAAIGTAFHRVGRWMALDAERLGIAPPGTVPDAESWKVWLDGSIPVAEDEIPIPSIADMMALLCGDSVREVGGLCVGDWVYRLNDLIDASSYDSNMNRGGEIRLPDPAFRPWRPTRYLHRVRGSPSQKADQWAEIMEWFREAHDHYLASVAPSIEHA